VPLGEVVRHRKEFITIDDLQAYKRPRVQLHAQGIVLRDEVPGALIKTKRQQVCRTNELLVAEIDAKVGGFGLVPESLAGSIVSSHYFLFSADERHLDPRFLGYFIRTATFRDQVEAQGSTNYAAIRPGDVLGYHVPLPPLSEQRRVVSHAERVRDRIEEVLTLRGAIELDARRLLLSGFQRVTANAEMAPMGEVAPIVRRAIRTEPDQIYPELGIRSFGRGTFHKPALSGLEIGSKRIFRIEPGDLLFSNVFAWEGGVAVAGPRDAGRVGSHRFITCIPTNNAVTTGFLCFFFLTETGLDLIGAASPGGAGRNRTLGLAALEAIEVPVPPIEAQRWFDALQADTASLRSLQAESEEELDALLPAVIDRAFRETSSTDSGCASG
jgi:type I restriction enzyme S subunit